MVEKLANDYAKYFQNCNAENELHPLCLSIEEMLTRLDEFETILSNIKTETTYIVDQNISHILEFKPNFQQLCDRIDKLEKFVDVVNQNVGDVEKTVFIAEEELGIAEHSWTGRLLRPLFGKVKKVDSETRTNIRNEEYQTIPVFNTSEYFTPENETNPNDL